MLWLNHLHSSNSVRTNAGRTDAVLHHFKYWDVEKKEEEEECARLVIW